MAHALVHRYYYAKSNGPVRDGESRPKCEIHPNASLADMGPNDLRSMAENITNWGEHRWANDHGSYADHLELLNFINLAMEIVKLYSESKGIDA
jgi:hypothetical protein